MRLRAEEIKDLFNASDYSRGLVYYHQGRVSQLEQEETPKGTHVTCLVRGTKFYRVEILEDPEHRIAVGCTCPQFAAYSECKHIAAAMLAAANLDAAPVRSKSDYQAQKLLQTYLARQTADTTGQVQLVPRLLYGIYADYPSFSFQVGTDRLYAVKNIKTFLENVDQRKTAVYGKNLTLYHGIEQFDERSRALIGVLMDEFSSFRSLGRRSYDWNDPLGSNKNEITLTGGSFDRWFDLLMPEPIATAEKGRTIRFREGDPEVELQVVGEKRVARLNLEVPGGRRLFGSASSLYAINDTEVIRCSQEFREKVYPLLASGRQALCFDLQDLPTFCSCVLPEIQDAVKLSDPEKLLEKYVPDECVPRFYFDMEEEDLLLRLAFRYGEIELPGAGEVKRDVKTEQTATSLSERYFTQSAGKWHLTGDPYEFLTGPIQAFHDCGEVFISDRLRAKRIQPSGAAVGLSVSQGILQMDVDTGEFPPEELEALYQSLLRRRKYHRLADGRYLELDGSAYEKMAEMAHMLRLGPKDIKKGKVTMPAARGLYLDGLFTESDGVSVSRDQQFRAMVRSFKSVAESDYAVPSELETVLRPYQKVGFQWLKTLESCGFGGILADEMGLGKTLEIIAYFRSICPGELPNLVVCPASLILNWGEELTKFAPSLRANLILGSAAERREKIESGKDADVWVTSYELLRQDYDQYAERQFYCCVLDEAQHVKNQSTLASRAVKGIRCRQRFVLTGTPIENRLSELWNLFDFLMPGYLYSHAGFVEKLEKPIVKSENREAAEQLRRLVQPFLLRRLKKDVLKELPPKEEHTRRILLSEEERKVYLATAAAARQKLSSDTGKLQILAALTQLRQVCCDPELCYENYTGTASKLEACMELCIGMTENGHQILLFSQFTSMLDRIRERLDAEHISNFTLQGSTTKERRAQLVRAFNAGEASVFLISLKAGGTGLNLTAADVVIHYDPWWNLAAQNQATDRAHRIGQTAHVQVYRLIAKDTIEEKILELQEKKSALMDAVSGEGSGILDMSAEELMALMD